MTRMNSFGEFVVEELPCAYPSLAALDPKKAIAGWENPSHASARRKCVECGKEFRTLYPQQAYCGDECRREAAKARHGNG